MKDLHNHLLYGIDDGSKSLEESINLLKEMSIKGVKEVVLTPHYIIDSKFTSSKYQNMDLLNKLNQELINNNINIKLYLGNEIYLDDKILEYINNNLISTLNESKYILVEFPLMHYPRYALNIFSDLIYNGYRVILAHPERYIYLYKDMSLLDELKDMGVLFQGNYGSLFDEYGKYPKKMLKKLLKKNYIDFLAGDIHHHVNLDLKKLNKKLKRYISEDKIKDILENNFDKVINNEEI